MLTSLRPEDVAFASGESLDKNGRLFFWEGGVYRGIAPHVAPLYRELLESGAAERLFELGLVRTEIAPVELEGYPLVLRHERVPVVSYVTEWSGSMLKDAALLTLDLNLALEELGLELQDAHPWNVLFDGCTPKFVDFTSIVPLREGAGWRGTREFVGKFLHPLLLMAEGYAGDARSLLVDRRTLRGKDVSRKEVAWVLARNGALRELFRFLAGPGSPRAGDRRGVLAELRERVSRVEIKLHKTAWSDYCDEEVELATVDSWITKRRVVHEVLQRCRPETLLDIGSNTGWFSKLAAMQGSRVVAFDVDEPSINKLYRNEEARRLGILPLSMSFTDPTPAYGLALRCEAATERFQADMVLGLAIVHHLALKQGADFDSIVGNFAAYARKWLLVEFIPGTDRYMAKYYTEEFGWYTTENFIEALKKHFSTVEVLPSNPEPRVLLLCER